MKFCYWDVRGLGEAPRLLLRYVGADYEDESLEIATYEKWFDTKFSFGLDFPNLPYLIDGDLKLTQSHAILKYLGRKYGLSATSDPQLAREDMLLFQLHDLCWRMVATAYFKEYPTDQDFKAEMEQLTKDLHTHLEQLEKFYPDTANWFTGSKLSYVDFVAYEMIDRYREVVQKDCLDKYSKLSGFMARFEALEPLKDYLACDQYKKAPIFAPMAKIGNVRRS